MYTIKIAKNTDCKVKLKCFDDQFNRLDLDLTDYIDFSFIVFEENKKIIIKKIYTQNGMNLSKNISDYISVIEVLIKRQDTSQLFINPADEEFIRYFELSGKKADGSIVKMLKGNFYLEDMINVF